MDKEMMKGNIDLILLSLIAKEDLYGYEMTKKLRSISDESYQMSEGTLYPSLKRMEKKGWIESYWNDSSGKRRKYYQVTEDGVRELKKKRADWGVLNDLVQRTSESHE
ncbi:PadR family transcriptional regulator [Geomicrobium sediminis]|uniref:DNA-binding PadR family transcriptional regulator n=1 Tax=Geomicrobium sediminis TaxID=1347788 RepID=A0ABS2PD05_9BACL|nr:PadR family transcriptional regulator [Geomicrobium sediminis]MBM7632841.1 DNA-binding PadR family transcriptional regulator [Geomicrobium sediminis]